MRLSPATRTRLLIGITFLIAMIVSLIRWPDWAQIFRPDWVGMVLIYWCLAIPNRVGVGTGWVVGLIEDILYGSLLGQYALAKTMIAFFAIKMHLKIRMFPRWQQAIVVFMMLLAGQFVVAWIRSFAEVGVTSVPFFTPSIVGMVLWPWLFVILRDFRRRNHID
jgi:rod shape-determining protein MreD